MIAQIDIILVAVSLLGHMAWGEIGVTKPLYITSSTFLSLFTIAGNLGEVNLCFPILWLWVLGIKTEKKEPHSYTLEELNNKWW